MSDKKAPYTLSTTLSYVQNANTQNGSVTPESAESPFDVDSAFEQARKDVEAGRFDQAFTLCEQVTQVRPDHPRAWHILGFIHLQRGNTTRALEALETSLRQGSTNPLMLMHLGIARGTDKDVEGSIDALQKAVEREPKLAPAHFNLGLSLSKAGRLDDAAAAFRSTLALAPNHKEALVELGAILMDQPETLNDAYDLFERALKLDAKHVRTLNLMSIWLRKKGRTPEAVDHLRRAVGLAPNHPELYANLGDTLLQSDGEEAVECFQKALELDADFPNARGQLAAALEQIHRTEEARIEAEAALRETPNNYYAALTLARCELREKNFSAAEARLEMLQNQNLRDQQYIMVNHTLASVFVRQGRHQDAFQASERANRRALETQPIDEPKTAGVYENLQTMQHWFGAERVRYWPKKVTSKYPDPIFFVGFPRSGTTLMEQILRSHPNLTSNGEFDWLYNTAQTVPGGYPHGLNDLTPDDIERLRQTYWELVAVDFPDRPQDRRLIDKMPLNVHHLGLVRRIFPQAKVLLAVRDPRDCVISGFMQPFHRTTLMDQFLTLSGAARLYKVTHALWTHYQSALGLDMMAYRYEDLAQNPRESLEKVLTFLEENWDETVLNHQATLSTAPTVATPSKRDVAEPIYTRSVQRWKNYESELKSVADALQPALEALGYADDE